MDKPGYKFCKGCNLTKPFKDFSVQKRMKFDLDAYCRPCKSKNSVEYRKNNYLKVRSYEQNYEKIRTAKMANGEMPHRVEAKKIRNINNKVIKRIISNANMLEETFLRNFGCSKKVFIARFENFFKQKPGMGWHNYGAWQMDHKKPLKEFSLDTEASRKLANHYMNLRPEWATSNMKKAAKYEMGKNL